MSVHGVGVSVPACITGHMTEGLCPGGLCPGGVSVKGGLCPGGSLFQEGSVRETPRTVNPT